MSDKSRLVQQRANCAIFEYLREVGTPPYLIKEPTFDETRDSAIECAKQNIEDSNLSNKEKKYAKDAAEKAIKVIAEKFKEIMKKSGRLV